MTASKLEYHGLGKWGGGEEGIRALGPPWRPTVADCPDLSVLWRKTGIGEFFNHGASPRALPWVPMTKRGAPPVMLILVDLPPSPWIRPGSASPRRHPVAAPRVAPWPYRAPAPPLAPPPAIRRLLREPSRGGAPVRSARA